MAVSRATGGRAEGQRQRSRADGDGEGNCSNGGAFPVFSISVYSSEAVRGRKGQKGVVCGTRTVAQRHWATGSLRVNTRDLCLCDSVHQADGLNRQIYCSPGLLEDWQRTNTT